jgi:hypothetical protein
MPAGVPAPKSLNRARKIFLPVSVDGTDGIEEGDFALSRSGSTETGDINS